MQKFRNAQDCTAQHSTALHCTARMPLPHSLVPNPPITGRGVLVVPCGACQNSEELTTGATADDAGAIPIIT